MDSCWFVTIDLFNDFVSLLPYKLHIEVLDFLYFYFTLLSFNFCSFIKK